MKHFLSITLALTSLILLNGCVSREQADERLKRGCEAGVELYVPEGYSIKEVKGADYSEPKAGNGDRKVTLHVIESDGWYDGDKSYSCNFVESFGFMNSTHKANIYQIDMGDGRVFGKKDDKIVGGFDEWLKITEKVDQVMNR